MKTLKGIEAAITAKEKETDTKTQELEAVKEMAAQELEEARAEQDAAEEAIDRKAYEKAAGKIWDAERKVKKAVKELEALKSEGKDELLTLEEELCNTAWSFSEDTAAYCIELKEKLEKKIEEVKEQEAYINALYARLGRLQGKEVRDFTNYEAHAADRLKRAEYDLSEKTIAQALNIDIPQYVDGSGRTVEPGRLAIPGQKVN